MKDVNMVYIGQDLWIYEDEGVWFVSTEDKK